MPASTDPEAWAQVNCCISSCILLRGACEEELTIQAYQKKTLHERSTCSMAPPDVIAGR